jgi:hypothetical protein
VADDPQTTPQVNREQQEFIPMLGRGYSNTAPPRMMASSTEGPLWRDIRNFRIHDGNLRRRETLRPLDLGLGAEGEPRDLYLNILGNGNPNNEFQGQQPLLIKDISQGKRLLVVTTQEIWLYRVRELIGGSYEGEYWVSLTPRYTDGTVSVSGAVVTGTGTAWDTRKINPGQMFRTDTADDWQIIESVDSNTQLTLKSNYVGTMSGTYAIKRTFVGGQGQEHNHTVFAHEIAGDLIVAGDFLGGNRHASVTHPCPAVIRVNGYEWRNIDPETASEYLTAAADLTGSLDTLDSWWGCNGMQVMDDGRIVLLNRHGESAGSADLRVFWSGPGGPSQLVWNTTPGGFKDVTEIDGTGYALGRWGKSMTVHSNRGIAYLDPTGKSDNPLATRTAAGAHLGCTATDTLKKTPIGEIFWSGSSCLCLFDGYRTVNLSGDIRHDFIDEDLLASWPRRYSVPHSRIDAHQDEYWIFFPINFTKTDDRYTLAFVYNWVTKEFTKYRFPGLLLAASDTFHTFKPEEPTGVAWQNRLSGICLVGYPSWDARLSDPHDALPMLYYLSEDHEIDIQPEHGNAVDQDVFMAESDDYDFGMPGVRKLIHRVVLFTSEHGTGTQEVRVGISRDKGVTWRWKNKEIDFDAGKVRLHDFIFGDAATSGEAWRFKIESIDTDRFYADIDHIMVGYQSQMPHETLLT